MRSRSTILREKNCLNKKVIPKLTFEKNFSGLINEKFHPEGRRYKCQLTFDFPFVRNWQIRVDSGSL